MPNIKNGKYIKCKYCEKDFYVARHGLKKGRKYCSLKCFRKDNPVWNKGLTKNDDPRMMSVSKKATAQMHREYSNGTRDKFAITKKAQIARRKQGLEKFKTDPTFQIGKRGYLLIYIPVLEGKNGNKLYHHYVWEQAGKTIPKGYHLHHINGNKLDNRIENLRLMTQSAHHALHYKDIKKCLKTGKFFSNDNPNKNYEPNKRDSKTGRFLHK